MSKKLIAGAGVVASFAVALAPLATFADTVYPNTVQDKLSVTIEDVCTFGYTYTDGTTVAAGTHTHGTKISGVTANPDTKTISTTTYGLSYGRWDDTTVTAYDSDPTTAVDVYDSATHSTQGTTASVDTAYGIMENQTVNTNFAKTSLHVVCNNIDGYEINAVSTDLVGQGAVSEYSIAQTSATPAATASTYSFQVLAAANDEETPQTPATNTDRTVTVASGWQDAKTDADKIVEVTPLTDKSAASFKKGDWYDITYGVGVDNVLPAGTYEGTVTYTLTQL